MVGAHRLAQRPEEPMTDKPPYRVNRDDLPEIRITPDNPENTAPFIARMCHGSDTSWMFAERGPGYHTDPHHHDAEQINYVVEGEIWFFVADDGYHCRAGDIMRIPPGKWHWAWNRGPGKAVVLESHSPPLTNADIAAKIVPLLGPDEDPAAVEHRENLYTGTFPGDTKAIEARAFSEEGES
jgi:mannose-6-phosphate isomerase-like protein (cupin superfamily)